MPETDNSSSKTININSKYSYRMWIYTTIWRTSKAIW
jgi:hypothetical protein